MLRLFSVCLLLELNFIASALGATTDSIAAAVQDNSFFIEEAYNQELGVVQHIWNGLYAINRQSGPDDRSWIFIFTQEWPVFSQTHQFSYTLPYVFLNSGDDKRLGDVEGMGDIALNYRLQVLTESKTRPAVAPRLSLILPTGDASRGLGNDVFGYQFNLPVSKIVSNRWTLHFNAGATFLPDVDGHDLLDYNLGGSAIFAVNRELNFMLEALANWNEDVTDSNRSERNVDAIISPGLRYAFNHPNDAQTVIGIAVPIGLTSDTPEIGVFLYASFEHFFYRPKTGK